MRPSLPAALSRTGAALLCAAGGTTSASTVAAPARARMPRLEGLRQRLTQEPPPALAAFAAAGGGGGAPPSPPQPAPGAPASPTPLPSTPSPLTDTFGRAHSYLRVSLTERCNLRCTYCMPPEGVPLSPGGHLLTPGELHRLAATFVRLGVTKVRLTGGEPTLRRDLVDVVVGLGELRTRGLATLAMTTNGVLLAPLLAPLAAAGLTRLNISLDTLQRERSPRIARRPAAHWDRAWGALHAAVAHGGFASIKVNVVVQRGVNDDEVPAFVALAARLPVQVRFIELMPFAGNGWEEGAFVPSAESLAAARAAFPDLAPVARPAGGTARDDDHDTATGWGVPGHPGSIGFISSMSDAFCGSCNRLRLTADGSLKVCLHGNDETSLRDVLRAGGGEGDLAAAIGRAVAGKPAVLGGRGGRHGLAAATREPSARPMVKIGG